MWYTTVKIFRLLDDSTAVGADSSVCEADCAGFGSVGVAVLADTDAMSRQYTLRSEYRRRRSGHGRREPRLERRRQQQASLCLLLRHTRVDLLCQVARRFDQHRPQHLLDEFFVVGRVFVCRRARRCARGQPSGLSTLLHGWRGVRWRSARWRERRCGAR